MLMGIQTKWLCNIKLNCWIIFIIDQDTSTNPIWKWFRLLLLLFVNVKPKHVNNSCYNNNGDLFVVVVCYYLCTIVKLKMIIIYLHFFYLLSSWVQEHFRPISIIFRLSERDAYARFLTIAAPQLFYNSIVAYTIGTCLITLSTFFYLWFINSNIAIFEQWFTF